MKSTAFLAFEKVKQESQRGQQDNGAGPQSQDQQAQSDFRGVSIADGEVRRDEVGILRQAPPDKDECDLADGGDSRHGNLLVEATARGLSVHQMIGILPDKAREIYQIPDHYETWTAMSIGYKAAPAKLPDALKERDLALRQRKPLREFIFTGQWGSPSPLVLKG